jgi:hypothetical protein
MGQRSNLTSSALPRRTLFLSMGTPTPKIDRRLYQKLLLQARFVKKCYTLKMKIQNMTTIITLKDKVVAHHISDRSDLITIQDT